MPIGNTGLSFQWIYQNAPRTSYGSTTLNGTAGFGGTTHGFRLVKTGPVVSGTVVPAGTVGTWSFGTLVAINMNISNSITVQNSGCTTPDVSVDMGSYNQSVFKGIGSVSTPAKPVTIAVNSCPTNLNSIQYQFIPVSAVLDATNGVLALSGDSTAAGIGLQLKDNNGNALKYDTNTKYTLSAYNKATGGSYTIPLTANYYQTASTVKPGSANAVLTFVMIYQ
jgi:major type 1 subunit fimbrin (pilin)